MIHSHFQHAVKKSHANKVGSAFSSKALKPGNTTMPDLMTSVNNEQPRRAFPRSQHHGTTKLHRRPQCFHHSLLRANLQRTARDRSAAIGMEQHGQRNLFRHQILGVGAVARESRAGSLPARLADIDGLSG